ncbi:hypothetical protein BKA70DRAFT_1235629 [Coprinopsis sp. MPI-PUGE-AT-0042]|nr:hypothetical protein BKA70DRAFT_1235629 [Coprinopsis sp. MPI-PUGE-AT-0042]
MLYGGREQSTFLSDLSFFYRPALREKKLPQFLEAVYARFFARFPEPRNDPPKSIEERIELKKTFIAQDLYWYASSRLSIHPQLYWPRIFELSPLAYERYMRPLRALYQESCPRPFVLQLRSRAPKGRREDSGQRLMSIAHRWRREALLREAAALVEAPEGQEEPIPEYQVPRVPRSTPTPRYAPPPPGAPVYDADGALILVDDSDEEIPPEKLTVGDFKLVPMYNLNEEVVDIKAVHRRC